MRQEANPAEPRRNLSTWGPNWTASGGFPSSALGQLGLSALGSKKTLQLRMSYIPAALSSLQSSTALLNSLQITHNPSLSLALLAPEATFETHLIRDAAPHELALFQPSSTQYDAPILLDSGDLSVGGQHEERWTAAKRAAPLRVGGWDKASPLKERRVQGQEDPNRCLKAAEKLLDI